MEKFEFKTDNYIFTGSVNLDGGVKISKKANFTNSSFLIKETGDFIKWWEKTHKPTIPYTINVKDIKWFLP